MRKICLFAILFAQAMSFLGCARADEPGRAIPAPVVDESRARAGATEFAVRSGGCFWGMQGLFEHVKGVREVVAGYAGGSAQAAQYETVSSGTTGHAESVRITFDPSIISYGTILRVFFSVAHDPTELGRQGPDVGTQYRSAIFPLSEEQTRVAKAYIAQLNQANVFDAPVVTTIEPGRGFYPAEDYHQDFVVHNPRYPYVVLNDVPKIEALKHMFPDLYRAAPALVASRN